MGSATYETIGKETATTKTNTDNNCKNTSHKHALNTHNQGVANAASPGLVFEPATEFRVWSVRVKSVV